MFNVVPTIVLGVLFALPLLFWLLYKHYTRHYNYWKLRGVPYEEPVFPFGSLKGFTTRKKYTGFVFNELYKKFSYSRYFGVYELNKPTLIITDPELIKIMFVKDFHYFTDRSVFMPLPQHSIARNLIFLTGQEWKFMRQKLTPTFTSGKMKLMFELMEKCSSQLKEYLHNKVSQNEPVNAKDVLARFTMDIVATCAFGLEINSFANDSQFFKILIRRELLNPSFNDQILSLYMPTWVKKRIANASLSKTSKFLNKVVKDAINYRTENNINRNDFLDLLINLNHNKTVNVNNKSNGSKGEVLKNGNKDEFTIEEMSAQASMFFTAGFETSSSLMTFVLYELSRRQDIQTTLYYKIKEAVDNNGGQVTYQLLTEEIPYLEQVINETLRMYGPLSIITRACTQTYQVPDSELVVERGQRVLIPIYCLHHDPQYFPDPHQFRPERFSPENSRGRHPYVFLPFGEGPRNCIGMRFGMLQAKLGLATVILNFFILPSPDQQVPIEYSTTSFLTVPSSPFMVILNKRDSVC